MKKIFSVSVALFVAVTFLSGCASIVSKSDYPVSISSQPEGAQMTIKNRAGENVFAGTTPTTINLKASAGFFKGETYTVTFEKEGFIPHTAQIERGVDGWYIAGNLVFGGLVGWLIVDPATGAMWTLKNLHVDMNSTTEASVKESVSIVTLDNVPEHLRSRMVRVN